MTILKYEVIKIPTLYHLSFISTFKDKSALLLPLPYYFGLDYQFTDLVSLGTNLGMMLENQLLTISGKKQCQQYLYSLSHIIRASGTKRSTLVPTIDVLCLEGKQLFFFPSKPCQGMVRAQHSKVYETSQSASGVASDFLPTLVPGRHNKV